MRAARPAMSGALLFSTFFPIFRTFLRRSAALRRSSAALRFLGQFSDDQQHSDGQGALLRGGDFRLSHLWDFRKYDRFPLTVVKLSPTLDKGGARSDHGSALLLLICREAFSVALRRSERSFFEKAPAKLPTRTCITVSACRRG